MMNNYPYYPKTMADGGPTSLSAKGGPRRAGNNSSFGKGGQQMGSPQMGGPQLAPLRPPMGPGGYRPEPRPMGPGMMPGMVPPVMPNKPVSTGMGETYGLGNDQPMQPTLPPGRPPVRPSFMRDPRSGGIAELRQLFLNRSQV